MVGICKGDEVSDKETPKERLALVSWYLTFRILTESEKGLPFRLLDPFHIPLMVVFWQKTGRASYSWDGITRGKIIIRVPPSTSTRRFIGTCKECKEWGGRFCGSPKLDFGDATGPPLSADGAGATGYEGDQASIETGPDFGCIHWEGK